MIRWKIAVHANVSVIKTMSKDVYTLATKREREKKRNAWDCSHPDNETTYLFHIHTFDDINDSITSSLKRHQLFCNGSEWKLYRCTFLSFAYLDCVRVCLWAALPYMQTQDSKLIWTLSDILYSISMCALIFNEKPLTAFKQNTRQKYRRILHSLSLYLSASSPQSSAPLSHAQKLLIWLALIIMC